VTEDAKLIEKTMKLTPSEQKKKIEATGKRPILSYNQTDFVTDRIAVEVQFGKYSFVAYDLFVKHMAFYIGDVIDVDVKILAMKSLQKEMALGVGRRTLQPHPGRPRCSRRCIGSNRRSAVGESTL
jgi:aminopeptidase N